MKCYFARRQQGVSSRWGCWLALLLLSGCVAISPPPDWQALYADQLGQPIVELNETALNRPFQDEQGNLTRLTWARLADGTTALLGLPAYGNPQRQILDRTVILTQAEWQQLCRDAIGQEVYGWSWLMVEDGVGNTIDIRPNTQPPTEGATGSAPDPYAPYCQFAYLPEGWVLRVVRSQGVVKSAR